MLESVNGSNTRSRVGPSLSECLVEYDRNGIREVQRALDAPHWDTQNSFGITRADRLVNDRWKSARFISKNQNVIGIERKIPVILCAVFADKKNSPR